MGCKKKKKKMLILKSTLLLLELSKQGDVQLWAKQSTSGNNQLLQGKFVYKNPSASHSTFLDTHPTTATFTGFMWVPYHTYLQLFTNTPWQGITVPLDPPAELVGSAPSHPISPQRAQVNKAFSLKCLPWLFSPDTSCSVNTQSDRLRSGNFQHSGSSDLMITGWGQQKLAGKDTPPHPRAASGQANPTERQRSHAYSGNNLRSWRS